VVLNSQGERDLWFQTNTVFKGRPKKESP